MRTLASHSPAVSSGPNSISESSRSSSSDPVTSAETHSSSPASSPQLTNAGDLVKRLAIAEAQRAAGSALLDLRSQADSKLEESAPKTKAVLDAVGPHAAGLIALTAKEMANDPQTIQKLAELSAKIGKNGFTKAMKAVGPEASRAFTKAAGMEAMNPVVVAKLLDNLPSVAAKVSPKLAGNVAKHCVAIEAKLGVKAAVKAGASAGKVAPAVGNVIAVASTTLAAASLLKSLGTKDPEKICKEGCNTLLQAVGIAFPWVALGGDLVDLGWTAKIALEGQESPEKAKNSIKESGELISAAALAACEQAQGAGDQALAKALADFGKATKDVTGRKQIEKSSEEALKRLAQSASTTFAEQAKNLPEGDAKKESEHLANSFGELFKVVLHHQKAAKINDSKRMSDAESLLEIQNTTATAVN